MKMSRHGRVPTLPLLVPLVAAVAMSAADARHVYPFQYVGSMPDMVRMVDDPRQVGVVHEGDELVEPPRYAAKLRDLKTHDFYPHDPRESGYNGHSLSPSDGTVRGRIVTNNDQYPANAYQPPSAEATHLGIQPPPAIHHYPTAGLPGAPAQPVYFHPWGAGGFSGGVGGYDAQPPSNGVVLDGQASQYPPGDVRYPQQVPGTLTGHDGLVFTQQQRQTAGINQQCFAAGAIRNEAMDSWCALNCNHVPSFCPASHCACGGAAGAIKKKKK